MRKIFEVVKDGIDAIVNVISDINMNVGMNSHNQIVINGHVVEGIENCKSVKIIVNGNAGAIETSVGNVEIHGDVDGNVEASCGNITCGKVSGSIHASCGNVTVN